MSRRIGIWGGSFDPVHIGHLILAQEAFTSCALDALVWIPAGFPPHKPGPIASADDRVAMVSLAIADQPAFSVSRIEVDRTGPSYTLQTLLDLREVYGNDTLCLLIGADNALDFQNWHEPERVAELAEVIVFARPGSEMDGWAGELRCKMRLLDSPNLEISSTDIRDRVGEGRSVRYWVPDSVHDYIERNQLYR